MTRLSIGWTLAAIVLALGPGARADEQQAVRYRDDRLSVELHAAPRSTVLDEVARATGATVRGRLQDPDAIVTATFEPLPLDEAMRRLLPKQAFALKYEGDRVSAIELLDASGVVRPPPPPAVIREPGETAEQAAIRASLSAIAIARENGMAPDALLPLEAIVGRAAEGP